MSTPKKKQGKKRYQKFIPSKKQTNVNHSPIKTNVNQLFLFFSQLLPFQIIHTEYQTLMQQNNSTLSESGNSLCAAGGFVEILHVIPWRADELNFEGKKAPNQSSGYSQFTPENPWL